MKDQELPELHFPNTKFIPCTAGCGWHVPVFADDPRTETMCSSCETSQKFGAAEICAALASGSEDPSEGSVAIPNKDVIAETVRVVRWLLHNSWKWESLSIQPDVLGGADISLELAGSDAWIAIMNDGRRTIVVTSNGKTEARQLSDESLGWMHNVLVGLHSVSADEPWSLN